MNKLLVYALKLLPSLSKFWGENRMKYINKKIIYKFFYWCNYSNTVYQTKTNPELKSNRRIQGNQKSNKNCITKKRGKRKYKPM